MVTAATQKMEERLNKNKQIKGIAMVVQFF